MLCSNCPGERVLVADAAEAGDAAGDVGLRMERDFRKVWLLRWMRELWNMRKDTCQQILELRKMRKILSMLEQAGNADGAGDRSKCQRKRILTLANENIDDTALQIVSIAHPHRVDTNCLST